VRWMAQIGRSGAGPGPAKASRTGSQRRILLPSGKGAEVKSRRQGCPYIARSIAARGRSESRGMGNCASITGASKNGNAAPRIRPMATPSRVERRFARGKS